ncbi:hypothetical protein FRC09_002240 [Ceratobasidium sp. 395]|nr:hypothetical protein FRC09_002240 [Ceratobasidium sp. 395]
MLTSETLYTARLTRFRSAITLLPSKLPAGSSVYNFNNWTPDPQLLEDYGTPCSVLNAALESTFGLRGQSPIIFTEKGPGLESLANVLERHLTGDYTEKAVIGKWLDDLIAAAERMSTERKTNKTKRVPKPSAAQKRTNDWIESTQEEKSARKQQKTSAAAKAKERASAIEKTAQECNWKHGFDDLVDTEDEPKLYTTSRKGYSITKELFIKCLSKKTNKLRYRCSSNGCQQSWSSAQPKRLFSHFTNECQFVDPDLLERVSEQAAKISLGQQAIELGADNSEDQSDSENSDVDSAPTRSKSLSNVTTQTTLHAVCKKEGLRAQQVHFDLSLVNFICAAQIAPRKIDMPEFHSMISKANSQLKPKSSSKVARSHIPMESCRIRRVSLEELRNCRNLTISFDGGTAIQPVSFTTIHVTTPDTRVPHLMAGVEASGIPHTGQFYFTELEKIIKEIGPQRFSGISCDSTGDTRLARELVCDAYPTIIVLPDPCHQLHNTAKDIAKLEYFNDCRSNMSAIQRFFSKSSQGTRHLDSTRQQMDIKAGLKRHSKTWFAGTYHSTSSTRTCLPAIERVVKSGVIKLKKDHPLSFIKNISAYSKFSTELHQLEKLLEPIAKAIQCLESGHSNPSDVMLFYLAVCATLRQYVDSDELGLPTDLLERAQASVCARFRSMVLATGQEVYLATFFVHPKYLNSDILWKHNLNPLNTNTITLPATQSSKRSTSLPDADLIQAIPAFLKIVLFLKAVFCRELAAGNIDAARDYPSTDEGVCAIIERFKSQVGSYARDERPFKLNVPAASINPIKYWSKLLKHPDACFLAPVAVKLFSLIPNSMAEERTVSCISRMNTKDRSCQKISTLIQMTQIRQHLLRQREKKKPIYKPVVKFRDLDTSLLKQHPSISSSTKGTENSASSQEPAGGQPAADTEVQEQGPAGDATGVNRNDDEGDESEGYDTEDEDPEPVEDEAIGFDPTDSESYGANLSSPLLLDLLSDSPSARIQPESLTRSVAKPSGPSQNVKSTAKKDVSGVDVNTW